MAERPGPLGAGGILVDAIEHAGIPQMPVGGIKSPVDFVYPEAGEPGQERPPMRAHLPAGIHHLIEYAGERAIG